VAATDVGALAVIGIVQQQDHWRRNGAQTDFIALEKRSLEVQASSPRAYRRPAADETCGKIRAS
jgi:hypothetical protein